MIEQALTADRILEAAEDVLRRHGLAKANVVDVARSLGVSHGSVYRHFPTKAALRDAVTERWLHRISEPLEAVAAGQGPAPERLRRWFDLLVVSKHARAREDPELFATYVALTAEARQVVKAHVETLAGQLTRIMGDGIEQGVFRETDPATAARAVLDATTRFHNPLHAREWSEPGQAAGVERVWSLVMCGLGSADGSTAEQP